MYFYCKDNINIYSGKLYAPKSSISRKLTEPHYILLFHLPAPIRRFQKAIVNHGRFTR